MKDLTELDKRRIRKAPNVSDTPSELLAKFAVIADDAVKAKKPIRILAFMVVDPEGDTECMEVIRFGFESQINLIGWVQVASEILTQDLYAAVETSG